MLIKKDIYFQDLSADLQSEIFREVANRLIAEECISEGYAEEEADYYINAHNFALEYKI